MRTALFGFCLLLPFLVSCHAFMPLPLEGIQITVDNERGTCSGGLKAQLMQGEQLIYEATSVLPGELLQNGLSAGEDFSNRTGASSLNVTVTAWCYGAEGEALGQREETLTLISGATGTARVTVQPQAGTDTLGCEVGSNGEPICIY